MESKKLNWESLEWVAAQMENRCFSFEELLFAADNLCLYGKKMEANFIALIMNNQQFLAKAAKEIAGSSGVLQTHIEEFLGMLDTNRKNQASELGRNAAYALHSKPGGAYEKHAKLREIFASGKYTSRDVCAEQECAGLDMAFSTARRALRNTPDPT